jgi:hypothetical protein
MTETIELKPELNIGDTLPNKDKKYRLNKGEYLQNKLGLTFIMQQDGNFVLYDNADKLTPDHMLWQSRTNIMREPNYRGAYVQLENGNLVIYDGHGLKLWETDNVHKSADMFVLDGFIPKLINSKSKAADKAVYSFEANTNLFPRALNAGVVLIGSLLWQDNGNNNEKNLRKNWRYHTFESDAVGLRKFPVKFPIRYGRMSSGNVYTMVVSSELGQPGKGESRLGTAILLKVKLQLQSMQDVLQLAYSLAQAEGIECGKQVVKPEKSNWAFISYSLNINKQIEAITKNTIATFWANKASVGNYYQNFKVEHECDPSINNVGQLRFLQDTWLQGNDAALQAEIDELDFVLTTVTLPKMAKYDFSRYPDDYELQRNVWADKSRFYFCNNYINGIKTFQDEKVLERSGNQFYDVTLKRGGVAATKNHFLHFNMQGQIQLINLKTLKVWWASKAYEHGVYLKLGSDFDLAIYDAKHNKLWSADGVHQRDIPAGFKKDMPAGCQLLSYSGASFSVKDDVLILSVGQRRIRHTKLGWENFLPALIWKSSPIFVGTKLCTEKIDIIRNQFIQLGSYRLFLSAQGELQLLNERHEKVWSPRVEEKAWSLSLNNPSGNIALYGVNGDVIWSIETAVQQYNFNYQPIGYNGICAENNKLYVCFSGLCRPPLGHEKLDVDRVYGTTCTTPFVLARNESAFFGDHELIFGSNGEAYLRNKFSTKVWASPKNISGNYLVYQKDGNLVICNKYENGIASGFKWSVDDFSRDKIESFINGKALSFDKKVVIEKSVFKVVVSNRYYINDNGKKVVFDDFIWEALYLKNVCSIPFILRKGEFIVLGGYRLSFGDDGFIYLAILGYHEFNIVFDSESRTNIGAGSATHLAYQEDGNLVIYNGKNPVWSIDVYDDKDRSDILRTLNISAFKMVSSKHYLKIVDGVIEAGITNRKISYKLDGYDVVVGWSDIIRKTTN